MSKSKEIVQPVVPSSLVRGENVWQDLEAQRRSLLMRIGKAPNIVLVGHRTLCDLKCLIPTMVECVEDQTIHGMPYKLVLEDCYLKVGYVSE